VVARESIHQPNPSLKHESVATLHQYSPGFTRIIRVAVLTEKVQQKAPDYGMSATELRIHDPATSTTNNYHNNNEKEVISAALTLHDLDLESRLERHPKESPRNLLWIVQGVCLEHSQLMPQGPGIGMLLFP
jgi:hypothetical protein